MKSLPVSEFAPFKERIWYEDAEIERICSDALKKADLYPTEPSPVRIERMVEKHFKITPSFQDLKEQGIMGYTLFGRNGATEMIIDQSLTGDDKITRNRYFSTLAHEAGHCLLHTHLFAMKARKKSAHFLCRHDNGEYGRGREWWEYQANRCIGALLLPEYVLRQYLKANEITTAQAVNEEVTRNVAHIFSVNTPVARLRLQSLRFPI